MEDKKEEKKTRATDQDGEHEAVKAEKKSPVMEKEREAEIEDGGSKAAPQLRSTMIKEEAGPKEAKAKAAPKRPLTTDFVAIWGLLNARQLIMIGLAIVLGMVLAGFIGSRVATRTDLGTRLGDLEQRVAELSNKVGSLGNEVSDLQTKSQAGSPSAGPSAEESSAPPESAGPSAQPSE